MNRVFKEIKEVIFKHFKKRLSFVGIKKIEQLKNSFNLLNNEIYDSLGYMNIASALEDKNINLDLSLNRNRFPESLNTFYKIAKRDFKILVDCRKNYGLFINLVQQKIDFLQVNADSNTLSRLKNVANKNKVIVNPQFSIINLAKIKNIESKIQKIYKV